MKFTATVLCILLAGVGRSATLAYWRMGDDTSSLHDSSGNGLTLTRNGNPPVLDVTLPYDGMADFQNAGAFFDNPVPQTGASNTKAVMNYSGSFLYVADPFAVTNFTVEAYFTPYTNKTTTQYLISHFTSDSNQRSWALGIAASGGTAPAGANEMFALLSSDGGNTPVLPLGFTVTAKVDYYIAFSYNAAATVDNVTLRYRDLTHGGPLQTITTSSGLGLLKNPTALLRIGAYKSGSDYRNMPGLIDEVRISDRILDVAELLISRPIRGTVMTVR